MTEKTKPLTYKDAGVDIDAGDALVDAIKPLAAATRRTGADVALGGFGALFDPRAAGFNDPILVSSTDGVGTKLKIAIDAGVHETVGIDLVAMCVNDLVVQGAEPLFFLDYFATGKLSVEAARDVISGIAAGCKQANCALIGGETAEMPGLYKDGDYDLAGFTVGAVERGQLLTGANIAPGDVVLGIASSGVHSNGYSLVRKVVERAGLDWQDPAPFAPEHCLAQALLTPTRIYVRSCLAAVRAGTVKSLAHITGGGITGNLPRSLPAGVMADIDAGAWPLPAVFGWLQAQAALPPAELARTFNCGLGMIAVCAADSAEKAKAILQENGETVYNIGTISARTDGGPAVRLRGETGAFGWPAAWMADGD